MTEPVNLRLTNPTLYRSVMVFALISVGLGLNFLLAKPTFNPYQIDRHIIGAIFLCLGLAELIGVVFILNLQFIRVVMALNVAYMMFWGIGTSITFFTGQTSLQLFVLYVGLSGLQLFLLLEPFVNPLTGQNGGSDAHHHSK